MIKRLQFKSSHSNILLNKNHNKPYVRDITLQNLDCSNGFRVFFFFILSLGLSIKLCMLGFWRGAKLNHKVTTIGSCGIFELEGDGFENFKFGRLNYVVP